MKPPNTPNTPKPRRSFGVFSVVGGSVLLLCASAAAAADVDVPGYEALTASEEARADGDGFLRRLAAVVAKDPASEAAALALLRIEDSRGDAADGSAAIRPALEKAAAAKVPDPLARDRALRLLAALQAEAGEWDAARATLARRGEIKDWLVVGPFGFTRRALHDRVFPVEIVQRAATIDVGEMFDGSAGKVGWRKAAIGPLAEGVAPSESIQPESGCAYALAQVRAPEGTKAVLSIACGGSFKAWWNGQLVADADRTADWHPSRIQAAVVFGSGWNRLLVKDTQSRAEIAAFLVREDGGGTIDGLEVEAGLRVQPRDGSPGSARELPLPAAPAGAGGFAKAAVGLALSDLGLDALALPLIEAAAKEEPRSAHLAWLHSRALEAADHLPATRRANDARAALERALERDPKFVPALERKARFLDDDGKPEEAVKALRALAKEVPGCAAARVSAAAIARRQGWEAESLEEIRAAAALRPRAVGPRLFLGDHYWRKENRAKALELYKEALAADRSARWIEERIASMAQQQGDIATAERIRRAQLDRYPNEAGPLYGLADLHRARGEPEKAAELYARAAEMKGGDPDGYERTADVLIEAGLDRKAVPWLERALAAEPGRFHLRRLLARIQGKDVDLGREWDVDVIGSLESAPGAAEHPKAHSICLLDLTVTKIHRDGSKVDYTHQAFKVLDDTGIQRYHTLHLPGEVLELRTIGTDGKIYEPILTDNTSEILMPKLEPGAVIEYRYRTVSAGRPPFQFDSGSFYFKDPNLVEPYERSLYVVQVEKGFEFETIERNMPLAARVERRADETVYVWDVKNSARLDEEPFMPTKDELLPHVQLVQRRGWDDIAEVYRERFMGRTRLTPELRAKARELTDGVAGDAEKARKIHAFVRDHVRSDGPAADAQETFLEKTGSRTILLKALLDAAAVPSRFAMCGRNPRTAAPEVFDPPRPELMTTSLLVVEPRDGPAVWIHDGGRLYPYGLIPDELHGAPAMLLSAAGGEMRIVPAAPLEASATVTTISIALSGGSDARLKGSFVVRDPSAFAVKERIATAPKAQLQNFVEMQLNQVFRGAAVSSFDFPGAEDPDVPFTVAYEATVKDHVQLRNDRRTMKTGLGPLELTKTLGGRPTREHPMALRSERVQRDEIEVDLGDGYEVESLPASLVLQERFGLYSLLFTIEGRKLKISRSFALLSAWVEPRDYKSVLRFCADVDAAEKKWIELRVKQQDF